MYGSGFYGGGYGSSASLFGSYPSSVFGGSQSLPGSSAPLSATSPASSGGGGGGGNAGGGGSFGGGGSGSRGFPPARNYSGGATRPATVSASTRGFNMPLLLVIGGAALILMKGN